jgi:hypothetical protein
MQSKDLYSLARRLHGLIPPSLRRWTGTSAEPDVRDLLANNLLMELTEVPDAPWPEPDEETFAHAVVISEALAGFVTMWGCRYGNLDEEVDRAQGALVTALGGEVGEPGVFFLREGTPLTVAAIAHLLGWVTILEVPEIEGEA